MTNYLGDFKFSRTNFKKRIWRCILLILIERKQVEFSPLWVLVSKKSSSYNPLHPRQTSLYFIKGKLSLHLELISNETNILKFKKCMGRNKISRGSYRIGLQNYFYKKEHLSFLFKILIYHILSPTWNVVFLFYLTACLACRQTECWIKTFNTLGQNLLLLIRYTDSFGTFLSLHKQTELPFIMFIALILGAWHWGRRQLPGHTWPAISDKFEDLSTEALTLTGNCLTPSSFICSQEDFKWILLTNVSLYVNCFKEKWSRTLHKEMLSVRSSVLKRKKKKGFTLIESFYMSGTLQSMS